MTNHKELPYRLHDMEDTTIVSGKPGEEVANCTNSFGDQDANARFIINACNSHYELMALVKRATDALSTWIVPDSGISDKEVLSQLLGIFDGPDYRDAMSKAA